MATNTKLSFVQQQTVPNTGLTAGTIYFEKSTGIIYVATDAGTKAAAIKYGVGLANAEYHKDGDKAGYVTFTGKDGVTAFDLNLNDIASAKSVADELKKLEDSLAAVKLTSDDKTVKVTNNYDLAVNIDGTTIVKDSTTGILSVAPAATTVTGEDAIEVTDDDGKKVSLKIDEANNILSQSADGLLATLKLNWDKNGKKLQLKGVNDALVNEIDASDFVIDGMLSDVELVGDELVFTFNTDAGEDKQTPIKVDLKKYITAYTAGNGIDVTSNVITAKAKEGDKYVEVTTEGIASKGIDDAIAAAVLVETNRAKAAEEAEATARKAVTGVAADTYSANADANYIDEAESLNDADVKLDAAIKNVEESLESLDGDSVKAVNVNGVDATVTSNKATVEIDATNVKLDKSGTGASLFEGGSIKDTDTVKAAIIALEQMMMWEEF